MMEFANYLTNEERRLMKFLIINAMCFFDNKRTKNQLDIDVIRFSGDIINSINKIEIQNTGSSKNKHKESK